ncbi:c-type cytochrome [Sphingomonas sp. LY29]|uniref:c-type cytochrome n=1 Tax=Sphingomonas sp. LY29 TaxID=3095341 RepID=UPI002D78F7DD|nr:c-type cytochrome [Sphingomonas sp. LY29]WRP25516.1 c-type cytochrome [Sphingomonas sp. LY29]
MIKHRWRVVGALALVIAGLAFLSWLTARPEAPSAAQPALASGAPAQAKGAAAFIGSGFGGISTEALESSAIPWKLAAAALVLDERRRDPTSAIDQATLRRVLTRFGFLFPSAIANLPPGVSVPPSAFPLGMTHGMLAPLGGSSVEVANIGCAACHAGMAYDASGRPRPDVAVLGAPNSGLDLEAYTQAIFIALRRHRRDDLLAAAGTLFPDMGQRERLTLRWPVFPLVQRRMSALAHQNRPMPFPNGSPGLTNGVAALKARLGTPLAGGGPQDDGAVSIPGLADRVWRTSFLADGAYAPPDARSGPTVAPQIDPAHLRELAAITTFFTVPSMGVRPEKAIGALDESEAIFTWLKDLRLQPFPGTSDRPAAERGSGLYERQCASCHGSYRERGGRPVLAAFPNWIGDVGTDPLRARLFDEPLAKAVRASSYRDLISVRTGRGYAAPPLAGVWSTAPYLHNGSVPTLAALLDPERRPQRFMVGGHSLDFESGGIRLAADGRYPAASRPTSAPVWYDTRKAGRANSGHRYGENLTPDQRRALIEFLKRL